MINIFKRAANLTLDWLRNREAYNGIFGGGETDSGLKITPEIALSYAPVFQAVSMLSADLAKLPVEPLTRNDDNTKDVARTHHTFTPVRRKANVRTTAYTFWRRFYAHVTLYNRSYAWIDWAQSGRVKGLYNLRADATDFVFKDGLPFYKTHVIGPSGDAVAHYLTPDEVLHVEGLSLDNQDGADLVHLARNAWGLGLAQEKFASAFYKQGARAGGILEIPQSFSRRAAAQLEEGFTKKTGGADGWFRTVILRDGAKFHRQTVAPKEGELSEASELSVRQVARFFNMPPGKLGVKDAESYNSKHEANRDYLDSTLSPWLQATAAELSLKLLSDAEQASMVFEHNTAALLRMDLLSRYSAYQMGIGSGVLVPDEARAFENMGPRPDGKGAEPVAAPGAPSPNDNNDGDDTPSNARNRVLYAATARARKKSENPRAFVEWLDSALKWHVDDYARQVGEGGADFFAPLVTDLTNIANTTPAEELRAAVDHACETFELGA